jgi:hypothetical protein
VVGIRLRKVKEEERAQPATEDMDGDGYPPPLAPADIR